MLTRTVVIIGAVVMMAFTPAYSQETGKRQAAQNSEINVFTNDDVIALMKAGFGKDILIAKVKGADVARFDTSTTALVNLKSKGVDDEVVAAMIARHDADARAAAAPPPPSSATPSPRDDQGPIDRLKSRLHRGNAQSAPATAASTGTRPCAAVTVEGSFFTGKTYKARFDAPGVTRTVAMTRATQYLVANGWKLQTTDRESGVITASVDVIMGSGQSAPFSVVVNEAGGATSIALSFATTGGTAASQSSVVKEFCALADAIVAEK